MCEIQVLDDTAPQYAKLDPRQYNGPVYGIVAAQRGYLLHLDSASRSKNAGDCPTPAPKKRVGFSRDLGST
jgi:hypothetical protein